MLFTEADILKKHFQGRRITVRELDIYYIKNDLFEIDEDALLTGEGK